MKKALAVAALLLASTARAGSVHVRVRWTDHSHRSGSRHGFDTRRLRQQRGPAATFARTGGRPTKQAPEQAKIEPQRLRLRRL